MPLEVTRGAVLLRQYLNTQDLTVPEFAEKHGFCRIQLQRALKGERKKISVDFALAIEQATNNAVPIASWAHDKRDSQSAAVA